MLTRDLIIIYMLFDLKKKPLHNWFTFTKNAIGTRKFILQVNTIGSWIYMRLHELNIIIICLTIENSKVVKLFKDVTLIFRTTNIYLNHLDKPQFTANDAKTGWHFHIIFKSLKNLKINSSISFICVPFWYIFLFLCVSHFNLFHGNCKVKVYFPEPVEWWRTAMWLDYEQTCYNNLNHLICFSY